MKTTATVNIQPLLIEANKIYQENQKLMQTNEELRKEREDLIEAIREQTEEIKYLQYLINNRHLLLG